MTLSETDIAAAAEHALRLDEGEARRANLRRASEDPEFRAAVAEWEADFAPLWDEVPEVAPPARVRRRLRRRLFGRPARPWRSAVGGLMAGLAGAAIAAVLLVPLIPPPPGDRVAIPGDSAPALVAELATEGDALRLLAVYDAGAGAFRVRRLAGAPPPGRDLEFWAIPEGGAPVSLGVIGETAVAPLPEALRGDVAGLTLAVSEEEAGGSVTGAPGDVLAVAPVTEL
jgi:anti-sigma-K factor RskA